MLLRAVPLGSPGSVLPAGVCTPGELERAAAILEPVRSHEFLAGRLALRALVAEAAGTDPRLVLPAYTCPDCGRGEHGAPGFVLAASAHDGGARLPLPGPGRLLPVAASMSRAGGWALLAAEVTPCGAEVAPCGAEVAPCGAEVAPCGAEVAPCGAEVAPCGAEVAPCGAEVTPCGAEVAGFVQGLGVDVAAVADFRTAIPDALFSAAERRRAAKAAEPAREAARIWARKEALLKALGSGLRGDPQSIETLEDPRVRDINPAALGLPPGFVAAVAQTRRS
ncbi:4'-phosphopantetheinyl transferase superfamily protein [Sinomonas sp. B1-1]|uniref:4'-phosphopantetheinyl transferase superfamily protein n=1 Tax=Sinomonas sp. B1-1 TaxID=3141454 RepID=UPI003D26F778